MSQGNTSYCQGPFLLTKAGRYTHLLLLVTGILLQISCEDKKTIEPDNRAGKIIFKFEHAIHGNPLKFDTMMYVNAAGNPYLVNEIQYFISDVRLYSSTGTEKIIQDWKDIHYVDTDIESSQTWEVYDDIDPGTYDSIVFTFGLSEVKNNSFMFVNPPEKDMFWPEYLGGGYHYMKLNGKWLPEDQAIQTLPFDFHLGIGQVYHSFPDSITGYVHNNFDVSLPVGECVVKAGSSAVLKITMQVDKWFTDPHVYDHDEYGGYIMQNQEAMQMVKENGTNVFTVEAIEDDNS